ncbi:MAG: FAD-binding oxidoreductase [Deltaproteobacteria bacterium]|nr:FAD-binding oxidoreductase [Deltaproteobacteria bacterium]
MVNNTEKLKWWGWGREGESYSIRNPQGFWSFLEQNLGPLQQSTRVSSLNDISLPPSRLALKDLEDLRQLFGEKDVTIDDTDRIIHSFGKSYVDLLRIRRGTVERAPDVVVFPQRQEQIQDLLALASRKSWAVVPFGGGTSVVGGVEVPEDSKPSVTLDLRRMNRVLQIDRNSYTAVVQSGVMGPALEKELNASGFTLGHFPQSFEFSTLGGWVATRSAGQNSTKYGKIENMVTSLRLVSPTGVLDSPMVPADAAGPSLLQCLIGSEGALGVITQAVVRLHPLPQSRAFGAYLFSDFASGVDAVKKMLQADLRPAVLRLSDPEETAMALLLAQSPRPSIKERLGHLYIRLSGFDLHSGALLLLIFEGPERLVSVAKKEAHRYARAGLYLGSLPARNWIKERFRHPYIRDDLLDRSVMVDTLETAAHWQKLPEIYAAVRQALSDSILATASGALVFGHLSHGYSDGASLYFTFMAKQQPGQELAQWQTVKTAATEAILKHGGALSHHHGIGSMHKIWTSTYLGKEGFSLLAELKNKLDPQNIMNPGKLFDASPES